VFDEVVRKYVDETPKNEKSDSGVTIVMGAPIKNKAYSFKGQFSKSTVIANPKFGDQFFEEISQTYICGHWSSYNGSLINSLIKHNTFKDNIR
jgi:hypothetical protein